MIYTFVCENFTGTLADFLRRSGVSGRQITRLREKEGLIRLNGRAAFTDCRVGHGDVVEIDVRESGVDVPPLALPLDMIYEDGHLCVVNKPAGLAVIATRAHYGKSLQNALAAEWGSGFVFHPVTRLDKDTSGVMIVAKNSFIHEKLDRQLRSGGIDKRYLAVISGGTGGGGTIDAPVFRPDGAMRRIVSPMGKKAVTVYNIVKTFDEAAVADVQLLTGRTHQIRLHMSHIGRPLLGDALYGGDTSLIGRQALHAREISFVHPVSGRRVTFEAPPPEDILRLLRQLGGETWAKK